MILAKKKQNPQKKILFHKNVFFEKGFKKALIQNLEKRLHQTKIFCFKCQYLQIWRVVQ